MKKELKHYVFYDCISCNPLDVIKAIKNFAGGSVRKGFTFRDIALYMNIIHYQEIDLMKAFVYLEKNGFIEYSQIESDTPQDEGIFVIKDRDFKGNEKLIYGCGSPKEKES